MTVSLGIVIWLIKAEDRLGDSLWWLLFLALCFDFVLVGLVLL